MDRADWLADRFEENRGHLRAVAFRMLGSAAEADDAVQESWIRLSRADTGDVENLGGWLTTVTARVCLDMLRARKSRREEPGDLDLPEPADAGRAGQSGPEDEALLADAIGPALLVVLDTLAPAERLAFVLHDMFDVPFDDIAPIVRRSAAATRRLASRARRRVHGASAEPDLPRQRDVVAAFLAAARGGDFDGLLSMLDPDVVLRTDAAGVAIGAEREVRGAAAVAGTFSGRARAAQPALVNGEPGLLWAQGGQTRMVFAFTIDDGMITAIEMIADAERIAELYVVAGR